MGFEWLAVLMFVGFFFVLISGYPVAFSFAGAFSFVAGASAMATASALSLAPAFPRVGRAFRSGGLSSVLRKYIA